MKIKRAYERQQNIKFSFRIIAAVTAVIIFAFLLILYSFGAGILRNNVKTETLNEMDVAENNIFRSSTSIHEFVKYLYSKNAFKSIINDETENREEISLSTNKALNEISIVMPYIYSIQFYNGITDKMYYTGMGKLIDSDREKNDIMKLKNSVNSFDSVLRSLNIYKGNSATHQNVISYFMYSEIENGSFIVFNIDISWIYDCISTNTFSDSDISLLFDENGNVIEKNAFADNKDIEKIVQKNKDTLLGGYGSMTARIRGVKHLIICKNLENSDITVFRAYPQEEIYSMINKFRMYTIVIGLLFELIIFILNMFFTHKIYEPILEFVNLVHLQAGGNDELLNVKNMVRKYKYQSEIETKESELWNAVFGNNEADKLHVENTIKKYGIDIAKTDIVAAVLEIENYYDLCVECTKNEVNALVYGIYNVTLEMVRGRSSCIGINGVNGTIILLIAVDDSKKTIDELYECFAEISKIIFENLDVSVSSYISERITKSDNISETIVRLMKNKVYRYNYGSKCCILPEMIKANIENPRKNISQVLLDRLKNDIIKRNADDIDETMSLIAEEIGQMDYYNELPQLLYVVKEVEDLFGRISSKSLFEMKSLSRELVECEALSDAKEVLCTKIKKTIMEILIEDKLKSENSMKSIADLAREIIETEYADVNLCADYIAEKLGIHSRKLSTGFKDVYNVSIVEYINNFRLEKSISILKQGNVSVKDVVPMVGFGNEAYFYRVFKKRYGTTPLKYIGLNQ